MKLSTTYIYTIMVWLGILLAPFGSGKTTHRDFFSSYFSGGKARSLSVDDYVFRQSLYQKTLEHVQRPTAEGGTTDRDTLRRIYLKLVKKAQKQYDRDLDTVIAGAGSNLILEESGRSPRWADWFIANTLKTARKAGYRIALFYLAVGPREAYTRCQQRTTVPSIPKSEFDECRDSAALAFVSLAPLVDWASVFLTTGTERPPDLFCTLSPTPATSGTPYSVLEHILDLRSSYTRSSFKQLLSPCFPLKGAWVTLVMGGDRYVPGALVLGQSLKRVETKFDTICMVAGGVSPEAVRDLERVFTRVRRVDLISTPSRPMRGKKQQQLYSQEFTSTIFTKWNCLTFVEYDKVVCVDADIAFQTNADDLFSLPTPAGTFDNPWHSGEGWYGRISHGDSVSTEAIRAAYKSVQGYVVFGSLVVLSPSIECFQRLVTLLVQCTPYGKNLLSSNGPDELAITELYVPQTGPIHGTWTHIDPRYHLIPWKTYSPPLGKIRLDEARAIHYFGKEKPWEMGRGTWPDLKLWWGVWDSLDDKTCLCI